MGGGGGALLICCTHRNWKLTPTPTHIHTCTQNLHNIYTYISIQVHMVCSHQRLLPLTYQHVLKNDVHDKGRIKEKLGSRGGG